MKLEKLTGNNCTGGYCPAVYKTDRGTFAVQGNLMDPSDAATIQVAPYEGVVEVPESLVRALAAKLANQG